MSRESDKEGSTTSSLRTFCLNEGKSPFDYRYLVYLYLQSEDEPVDTLLYRGQSNDEEGCHSMLLEDAIERLDDEDCHIECQDILGGGVFYANGIEFRRHSGDYGSLGPYEIEKIKETLLEERIK